MIYSYGGYIALDAYEQVNENGPSSGICLNANR